MAVSSTMTATDGRFTFGVPRGFGPLPPDLLEQCTAAFGPSLAMLTDLSADGLPMILCANDLGTFPGEIEAELWSLSQDRRDDVERFVAQGGASLTHGPQPIFVDGARAICFAAQSQEGGRDTRDWRAWINHHGEFIEFMMQTQPELEEHYLPVWWTALGTCSWNDRRTSARQDEAHSRSGPDSAPPSSGDGWDVTPLS